MPVEQGRAGQACTEMGLAERETAIAAKLTVVEPVCAEGLEDVAEIVTGTSLGGGVAGAVYVTEVLL